MSETSRPIILSSLEVSRLLGISRVTISKKAKQLKLDLGRETFKLEVVRYRWSKRHIKKLIESFRGRTKREYLTQLAKEKGLLDEQSR